MDGEKMKILIVDDDAFLLDMYALKFSQNNFEVHTASGGLQALDKLRGGLKPEIILSDLIMPEMDGFEMLEKIKEEGLKGEATIVILSNKGQTEDVIRGEELGASGYIVKANSTPAEVITQVMEFLPKKVFEN
jgi:DNA-binding response OmpR family regulator